MSIKDARTGVPVDWSDPEEASLQAKIDVLRNMVANNPISYSEKEELVKKHLSGEASRARAEQEAKAKAPTPKWKI